MKKISLISQSAAFQEYHFGVADFYGKETVCLCVTEYDFIMQSHNIAAFDTNKNILPYMDTEIAQADSKYNEQRIYYCPNEFFAVVDKGSIGFDSFTYVVKGSVAETETEFIVSISIEDDSDTVFAFRKAYARNCNSIPEYFNEHFCHRVNEYPSAVAELVERAERTYFLEVYEGESVLPLNVEANGAFSLAKNNTTVPNCYECMQLCKPIEENDYLYRSIVNGVIEIAQVQRLAHDVYGDFYAVVKLAYISSQNDGEIKEKFTDFYRKHCITEAEQNYRQFKDGAEKIAYIPTDESLGAKVIYQKLQTKHGNYGISNDIFQFILSGFAPKKSMTKGLLGTVSDPEDTAFIRVETGLMLGTLIQVENRYKIMLYKCTKAVKINDEYYAELTYDDESDFFPNFSRTSKVFFKRCTYRGTFRRIEYLLCRKMIQPFKVSREEYDSFARDK